MIQVRSRAGTRGDYLKRPDLGRLLDPDDAARLQPTRDELAIIVADGLSATAVQRHAAALVAALVARLAGWRIAPIVLATQARVALGDAIGERLGVDCALVLIGERPGLSAPRQPGRLSHLGAAQRANGQRAQLRLEHPPAAWAELCRRRRRDRHAADGGAAI